jgi:hypothetical protein
VTTIAALEASCDELERLILERSEETVTDKARRRRILHLASSIARCTGWTPRQVLDFAVEHVSEPAQFPGEDPRREAPRQAPQPAARPPLGGPSLTSRQGRWEPRCGAEPHSWPRGPTERGTAVSR